MNQDDSIKFYAFYASKVLMAAVANPNKVHFPSEQMILDYLAIHPLTDAHNPQWYAEKRIAQAVARVFANATIEFDEIKPQVVSTLYDLNLGVPDLMINIVTSIFAKALIDCVNGVTEENLRLRNSFRFAT